MLDKQHKQLLAAGIFFAVLGAIMDSNTIIPKGNLKSINDLKADLKKAIEDERYEDAARIRDEINLKLK